MKVLIIDNIDSFTYNLAQIVEQSKLCEYKIIKINEIKIQNIVKYDKIIISPGPGLPSETGQLKAIIKKYASSKSIFGVCLGHQAIAEVFGAKLKNLKTILHGESTDIFIKNKNDYIFKNIPDVIKGGRYHSWVIDRISLPNSIKITAVDKKKNIMAISHAKFDVKGVQFHPESIMTEYGKEIIWNWLRN
ncbi:MAG: aminodeoxychorismate/anthranilate synthase component II [Bacteroidota bacterium]|nr:aminodeoxychorismate/anthranilate synthase component II [Bacteroidota bacterium]